MTSTNTCKDMHETFLLPSLIGGLTWMAAHARSHSKQDFEVLLKLFGKLCRPVQMSADAQLLHAAVMGIVAGQLENCFKALKKRHPNRSDIEPLLQLIKRNVQQTWSTLPSLTEYDQWIGASSRPIGHALKDSIQKVCQWASMSAMQPSPPNYTHRQLYASLRLLGAVRTLKIIIEETKAQTEAGNGAAALDVAVSLITAPLVDNSVIPINWLGSSIPATATSRTRNNLRDALQTEFDNVGPRFAADQLAGETVVRLHRRLEALLAVYQQMSLNNASAALSDAAMANVQSQALSGDLDKVMNEVTADAIAATGSSIQGLDTKALSTLDSQIDFGAAGSALDLSAMGVDDASTSALGADLGDLPDLDLDNLDNLDMSMGLGEDDDAWGLDFSQM